MEYLQMDEDFYDDDEYEDCDDDVDDDDEEEEEEDDDDEYGYEEESMCQCPTCRRERENQAREQERLKREKETAEKERKERLRILMTPKGPGTRSVLFQPTIVEDAEKVLVDGKVVVRDCRLQVITCMEGYKRKSCDELRFEDYCMDQPLLMEVKIGLANELSDRRKERIARERMAKDEKRMRVWHQASKRAMSTYLDALQKLRHEQMEQALALFSAALSQCATGPHAADSYFRRAKCRVVSDIATAQKDCEQAVMLFNGHAKAHCLLGCILTETGQEWERAEAHLERANSLDKSLFEPGGENFACHRSKLDLARERAAYTRLVIAAEAKKVAGNSAMSRNAFTEAERLYTEAISLCPDGERSHIYFCNRAAARCEIGTKLEQSPAQGYEILLKAVDDCDTTIRLQPSYAKAQFRRHFCYGAAYFLVERLHDSLASFSAALELDPTNSAVKYETKRVSTAIEVIKAKDRAAEIEREMAEKEAQRIADREREKFLLEEKRARDDRIKREKMEKANQDKAERVRLKAEKEQLKVEKEKELNAEKEKEKERLRAEKERERQAREIERETKRLEKEKEKERAKIEKECRERELAARVEKERREREHVEYATKAEKERREREHVESATKAEKERREREHVESATKAEKERRERERVESATKAEKERREREHVESATKAEILAEAGSFHHSPISPHSVVDKVSESRQGELPLPNRDICFPSHLTLGSRECAPVTPSLHKENLSLLTESRDKKPDVDAVVGQENFTSVAVFKGPKDADAVLQRKIAKDSSTVTSLLHSSQQSSLSSPAVLTRQSDCPQNRVGVVIGSKGTIIAEVMKRSGARITINQDMAEGLPRKVIYTGTAEQIDSAKLLVNTVIVHGPNAIQSAELIVSCASVSPVSASSLTAALGPLEMPPLEFSSSRTTNTKTIGMNENDGLNFDDEIDLCIICVSPMNGVERLFSLGKCDHKKICCICAMRMRAIGSDLTCAVCRQSMECMVATGSSKSFSEYQLPGNPPKGLVYHRESRIFFPSEFFRTVVVSLWAFVCRECKADLNDEESLKNHYMTIHNLKTCSLCWKNKQVFPAEHDVFSPEEYEKHVREGGSMGNVGHPECAYCDIRFYNRTDLLNHVKKDHVSCHLCQGDASHFQYYRNMKALEDHHRKVHFACDEPGCMGKQSVVFRSLLELQGHKRVAHSSVSSYGTLRSSIVTNSSDGNNVRSGFFPENSGRSLNDDTDAFPVLSKSAKSSPRTPAQNAKIQHSRNQHSSENEWEQTPHISPPTPGSHVQDHATPALVAHTTASSDFSSSLLHLIYGSKASLTGLQNDSAVTLDTATLRTEAVYDAFAHFQTSSVSSPDSMLIDNANFKKVQQQQQKSEVPLAIPEASESVLEKQSGSFSFPPLLSLCPPSDLLALCLPSQLLSLDSPPELLGTEQKKTFNSNVLGCDLSIPGLGSESDFLASIVDAHAVETAWGHTSSLSTPPSLIAPLSISNRADPLHFERMESRKPSPVGSPSKPPLASTFLGCPSAGVRSQNNQSSSTQSSQLQLLCLEASAAYGLNFACQQKFVNANDDAARRVLAELKQESPFVRTDDSQFVLGAFGRIDSEVEDFRASSGLDQLLQISSNSRSMFEATSFLGDIQVDGMKEKHPSNSTTCATLEHANNIADAMAGGRSLTTFVDGVGAGDVEYSNMPELVQSSLPHRPAIDYFSLAPFGHDFDLSEDEDGNIEDLQPSPTSMTADLSQERVFQTPSDVRAQLPPDLLQRLIGVLMKHPEGILGSQFPDAYNRLYKEKLVLKTHKGRKIKLLNVLEGHPNVRNEKRGILKWFYVPSNPQDDCGNSFTSSSLCPVRETASSLSSNLPPGIEVDLLAVDVFPKLAWLGKLGMQMYRWAGNSVEWTEFALRVTPDVAALFDSGITGEQRLERLCARSGCDISIGTEVLLGREEKFLVFVRGDSGKPSNSAMDRALELVNEELKKCLDYDDASESNDARFTYGDTEKEQRVQEVLDIPQSSVGLVAGKGGKRLIATRRKSGAYMHLSSSKTKSGFASLVISGTRDAVDVAVAIVLAQISKLKESNSSGHSFDD